MKIPGIKFLVPLLIGTVFAACSPTHMVTHSVTSDDLTRGQLVVVDDQLYYTKGVRQDTLVCKLRTQASPNGDGTRVPVTLNEASAAGLTDNDLLKLTFRPDAVTIRSGDSLLIPLTSLSVVTRSEVNPLFIVGLAVIVGGAVLVGIETTRTAEHVGNPLIRMLSVLTSL